MSPTRRKTTRKTARPRVLRQESMLVRAGLVRSARLTDTQRTRLATLTMAEVRALVSVKRKLRYPGTLHIGRKGIIF